jgi:FkbH-like protein
MEMAPADPSLDYSSLLRDSRRLSIDSSAPRVKVALLSDASTQRLVPLLRALFARQRVEAEIYEAPFDAIELEVRNPQSGLYQFAPQFVVLMNSVQAFRARFLSEPTRAADFIPRTSDSMAKVWDAIQATRPTNVIQSNFVLPYERFFGNFDWKVAGSLYASVAELNLELARQARTRGSVLMLDVDSIASWLGRKQWFEDRFWDTAKYPCAPECLPHLANAIVSIVMAGLGRTVKCVVVDLDNTLWGGVIGDDGVDGIQINPHGDGEAFYRFQLYLRALKQRGILLAVCSKNDEANALVPFDKHPDMILRREDFAVFIANWSDKAVNIRRIREELNIGFDAMVFLDDNLFERNLVRELVPDVIVPELPEDPADYVRAISELNLFEATTFSAEDTRRADLYRVDAERRKEQAGFASLDEFLQSLDMRIVVERFDSFHLPRISQLMHRSNQFNLTTRRLSETECKALMDDPRWLPLYASLSDRLGDHGLISVVTAEVAGDELAIRDWLMSCRVLGRGVESFLMDRIVRHAVELGLARVTGTYVPTAKNGMVKDFFGQFGFVKTDDEQTGTISWSLVTSQYKTQNTFLNPGVSSNGAARVTLPAS